MGDMKNILSLLGILALLVLLFVGAILAGSSINSPTTSPTTDSIVTEEALPYLGKLPKIEGIASWINSKELAAEDLEGKVVLIDFWTYSCINCIRTLPYIRDWWGKYEDDGLLIIGVHTPEFDFENVRENVIEAAQKYGLTHPIAQDNDYVTWRNFNNRYWPAKYLFDRDGNLRYYHFGEGSYDETESAIQALLGVNEEMTTGETPDYESINSPETYFGWWRDERFASPEGIVENASMDYSLPDDLDLNEWALEGSWTVNEKYTEAQLAGARFQFRYSASVVNLVMATADGELQDVVVKLDEKVVPSEFLGQHLVVDELTGQTFVQVEFSSLYELIDGEPGDHLLEIEVLEPGLQIYAITFG